MSRQEESLTGGGRGGERWAELEETSTIGDGGQVAVSLMPEVDGLFHL